MLRKTCCALPLVIGLLGILGGLKPVASATHRLFVLDASGSMRAHGLFSRIKQTLNQDYVAHMQNGEHIVVLTFDEDVNLLVDQRIESENDIAEVQTAISHLEAVGKWTWMSKALEITMNQAERLKAHYREDQLKIYFLTDGVNDPPPSVKEPMLKFVEVLWKYFEGFEMSDAYVYVLLYRDPNVAPAIDETQKAQLTEKTEGRVQVQAASPSISEPIPPEVHLSYAAGDLGSVDLSAPRLVRTLALTVEEMRGPAAGQTLHVTCERLAFPDYVSFNVEPSTFVLDKVGQTISLSIEIPRDHPTGAHSATLSVSSPGVQVTPPRAELRFQLLSAGENRLARWIAPAALAVLLLAYTGFVYLRKQFLTVKQAQAEVAQSIVLRGSRSFDLACVGCPDYALSAGSYPHELTRIFLLHNGIRQGPVEFDKPLSVRTAEGSPVDILVSREGRQRRADHPQPPSEPRESADFFRPESDRSTGIEEDGYSSDVLPK